MQEVPSIRIEVRFQELHQFIFHHQSQNLAVLFYFEQWPHLETLTATPQVSAYLHVSTGQVFAVTPMGAHSFTERDSFTYIVLIATPAPDCIDDIPCKAVHFSFIVEFEPCLFKEDRVLLNYILAQFTASLSTPGYSPIYRQPPRTIKSGLLEQSFETEWFPAAVYDTGAPKDVFSLRAGKEPRSQISNLP